MPAGTGRVATTLATPLFPVFLYSAAYSMVSPGLALSLDCFCSLPLTMTILLAVSTTFTSARSGRHNESAMAVTSNVFGALNVFIRFTFLLALQILLWGLNVTRRPEHVWLARSEILKLFMLPNLCL